MSQSFSQDIVVQEQRLLEDANSLTNTIGPMAMPLIFLLLPVIMAILIGMALNAVYAYHPPLVFNSISPAWPISMLLYPMELWYWVRSGQGAWRPRWIDWRYWRGELHTDIQVRLREIKFMGKAQRQIALKTGEAEPREMKGIPSRFGFIENPVFEGAGDFIYEFWFRSKRFPLAIVSLPFAPELMLNFVGNLGLVQNGGFLFGTDSIAAVDFIRTDFTKTEELEFVPIGIFGFYAKRALEIAEGTRETVPVALEQAAKVRDTFYATDYKRKWLDERALREKVESQEQDIDKKVDRRVGEIEKHRQKGGEIHLPGRGSKIVNDWGGIIVIVVIIALTILAVRFL